MHPSHILTLLVLPATLSAQVPSTLIGSWRAGPATITLDSAGHRIGLNGQVAVTGRFRVTRDTIWFQDLSGRIACNPEIEGKYLWKLDDSSLTFTLVADRCPGRSSALPRTWNRAAPVKVLTGVTLIDGTGGPARPGTTIVITGERISDVFPDGSKSLPSEGVTRDLRGRYVIPGLIDTHVHLATDPSGEDNRATIEDKLKRTLLGGVTSVRDMAGDARSLAALARDALVGDIVAPRIYYSAIFAGPDFFTDPRVQAASRGVPVGKAPWARAVTMETDWHQAIAEARGTGASGIKLYAALGPEVLGPIVREAHAQGLKVWAHATLFPARPSEEVSAGVDVLSHAPLLAREVDTVPANYRVRYQVNYPAIDVRLPVFDRLLGAMATSGNILEPTLNVFFSRDSTAPAPRWAAEITRRARELHVMISAGTDEMIDSAAALPNIHRELELLVTRAGFPPAEAIAAATSVAARAVGIDSLTGKVMSGMLADLVILSRDPLADIRNSSSIEMVIRGGREFVPGRQ